MYARGVVDGGCVRAGAVVGAHEGARVGVSQPAQPQLRDVDRAPPPPLGAVRERDAGAEVVGGVDGEAPAHAGAAPRGALATEAVGAAGLHRLG